MKHNLLNVIDVVLSSQDRLKAAVKEGNDGFEACVQVATYTRSGKERYDYRVVIHLSKRVSVEVEVNNSQWRYYRPYLVGTLRVVRRLN